MKQSGNVRSHSDQIERAAIWFALIFGIVQAVAIFIVKIRNTFHRQETK